MGKESKIISQCVDANVTSAISTVLTGTNAKQTLKAADTIAKEFGASVL